SAELVVDFAVARIRLLEEADRCGRNITHRQLRQNSPQFRKSAMLQIQPPRIFGSEVHLDMERLMNLADGLFVRFGKRVAAAFRKVPTRAGESAAEDGGGCDQGD